MLASVAAFTVASSHSYSLGIMIAPLEAEFGWSRAEITSGMMVYSFLSLCLTPVGGMLIDRFGPRRVGLIGIVTYMAGLFLFSLAGAAFWTWIAVWCVLGFCAALTKPTTWSTAVSSRFFAQRALALAILFCSVGLSSALVPLWTATLVEHFGWRGAYRGLSITGLLIAFPLLWRFFYSARERPFRAKGEQAEQQAALAFAGLDVREALFSTRFLRFALLGALMGGLMVGMNIHLVPILMEGGLGHLAAAATASFLGIGVIGGQIATGLLLDRFRGQVIGGVSFLISLPAYYLLLHLQASVIVGASAALLLGLGVGSQSGVMVYITTRYFGLKKFGTIYGMILAISMTGAAWPAMIGYIYDTMGTYHYYLQAAAPLYLVCGLIVLTMGPYPDFDRSQ